MDLHTNRQQLWADNEPVHQLRDEMMSTHDAALLHPFISWKAARDVNPE
jgi:hypothetical protein